MKDMKQICVPVLTFVGAIIICAILASLSYGEPKSRHSLGYINNTSDNGSATLNSTTFTKIIDDNIDRIHMTLCSQSKRSENKVVFINYAAVSGSVNNTGIILFGEDCFSMPPRAIYTGEVTAISTTGTPLLTYIEY